MQRLINPSTKQSTTTTLVRNPIIPILLTKHQFRVLFKDGSLHTRNTSRLLMVSRNRRVLPARDILGSHHNIRNTILDLIDGTLLLGQSVMVVGVFMQ